MLQLAAQLASLDEQKQRLGKRTTDLRSLIDHYLAPPLLEYELSKVVLVGELSGCLSEAGRIDPIPWFVDQSSG